MSSKKQAASRIPSSKKTNRPILWIGGGGLPGGALGKKLAGLDYPLHWEPVSSKVLRSLKLVEPVLVVVEAERLSRPIRTILDALNDLKSTVDLVVFQLRKRLPPARPEEVDGVLLRDTSLVQQISAVLGTIEGGRHFKSTGARAIKKVRKAQAEILRLRNLAVRDDLTTLYNLRFFNRSLETEHQRATRFGRSYSLVFLDLDGLKEVNSRRGHLVGAQVLQQVGELLNARIRQIDLPARIGGDEFVIICPETAKPAARLVAERLRHGIQRLTDSQGKSVGITASIGVASFPDDGDVPEEVLQRADRALYEAKALGKNRVSCWGDFAMADDDKSFLGSVHGTGDTTPTLPAKK